MARESDFRIVLRPKDAPKPEPIEEHEIEEIVEEPEVAAAPMEKGENEGAGNLALDPSARRPEPAAENAAAPAQEAPTLSGLTAPGEGGAAPVTCPLCGHVAPPAERLAGGRVRCQKCTGLFVGPLPEGSRPAARPTRLRPYGARIGVKKSTIKQGEDKSKPKMTFAKMWKRPLLLTAASTLGLASLFLLFPKNLLGKTNHLTVVPAQGVLKFQGKAAPGAVVFLHPVGIKDVDYPTPRATVKDDGTFILGTYATDDGAPVGEYKATAQWFAKVDNPEKDDGVIPRNQLPGKYARVATSGLSVRIVEGENKIPTIELKR